MENSLGQFKLSTVLFDLDGTLLGNTPIDVFTRHYMQAISTRMSALVPPKQLIQALFESGQAMAEHDPALTNEEVFAAVFYPRVGCPRDTMEPHFFDFYDRDFPGLQQYVQRKPEARRAVQTAFDLGYRVAVATNPVFPATATRQRLEWAGVADFPYLKVTTYENCHAAKPNLDYYRELLAELGSAPEETLMVGDEDMDMVAAHLGCATFLITESAVRLAPTTPPPTYTGTLGDLIPILQAARAG